MFIIIGTPTHNEIQIFAKSKLLPGVVQGITQESTIGVIKGDIRSCDNGSYGSSSKFRAFGACLQIGASE